MKEIGHIFMKFTTLQLCTELIQVYSYNYVDMIDLKTLLLSLNQSDIIQDFSDYASFETF